MSEEEHFETEVGQQLRRERELSEQIVANTTNMIFSFDRNLRLRVWNPQAERLTGIRKEEAWDRHAATIPQILSLVGKEQALLRVLAGESLRIRERPLPIPSLGVEAVLDVVLTPLRDPSGEVEGGLALVHDITRYKRAEDDLRASEERLREAQRLAHVGSWDCDLRRNALRCSDELFRIAGRPPPSTTLTVDYLANLIHPEDRDAWRTALQQAIADCRGLVFAEGRVVRPDGSHRVVETRMEIVCEQGRPTFARGTWLDITERKIAQADRERERQFRMLAENSTDIIVRLDRRLKPLYVNPAAESILGREQAESLRKPDGDKRLPRLLSAIRHDVKEVLATGKPRSTTAAVPTPQGERYLDSRIVPEFGPDRTVDSVLVVDRDITDIKRAQQALEELTLVDPLTGIPNRRHLDKLVAHEWRREARHRHPVALIMIDIDHFKAFNDHYGHPQGDECLRRVARLLRRVLHRPGDLPVRYGGEEFVVFLPETGRDGAREIAEHLREGVSNLRIPHAWSTAANHLTISLGVASLRADQADFPELMAAADRALYRAKERGRNRVEAG